MVRYMSVTASKMTTENIRKLARRITGRKTRSFLTAAKPFADT